MTATANEITDRRSVRLERLGIETDIKIVAYGDGVHILAIETFPTGLRADIHLTREEFQDLRVAINGIA